MDRNTNKPPAPGIDQYCQTSAATGWLVSYRPLAHSRRNIGKALQNTFGAARVSKDQGLSARRLCCCLAQRCSHACERIDASAAPRFDHATHHEPATISDGDRGRPRPRGSPSRRIARVRRGTDRRTPASGPRGRLRARDDVRHRSARAYPRARSTGASRQLSRKAATARSTASTRRRSLRARPYGAPDADVVRVCAPATSAVEAVLTAADVAPVVANLEPTTIDDVAESFKTSRGRACGVPDRGEDLVAKFYAL